MIVDSHAHLEMEQFDTDRPAVLSRAQEIGIEFILCIGNAHPEKESMERSVELCREHSWMAATVGIHPHDAKIASDEWYQKILDLTGDANVWAIGEIGLDYHYDFSPRDAQIGVFRDMLIMARELELPVIIHNRDADADMASMLEQHWAPPNPGGIMHCFAGDSDMARLCMDLGFLISFAGNITFKKAEDLRTVATSIPTDRLLAETDCPYLAPVPRRGRRNEPAYVQYVIETLAELHQMPASTMARLTTENFKKLFGKQFSG